MVNITCSRCGNTAIRRQIDVDRSVLADRPMYCSLSCAAKARADLKRSHYPIEKSCLLCQKKFVTLPRAITVFCSRSCASRGSMSEERREAQRGGGYNSPHDSISISRLLNSRESWKYTELKDSLIDRDYEFEFELNGYVFDLVLKDTNTIIEFDSNYHTGQTQIELDAKKQQIAESLGYRVVRLATNRNEIIPSFLIVGL